MRTRAAATWAVGETLQRTGKGDLVRDTRVRMVAAVILAVAAVFAAGSWLVLRDDGLPDEAAFSIGDNVVTAREVSRQAQALEALYGLEPAAGASDRQGRFRRDVARTMAVTMLIGQKAQEMGIQVPPRRVREAMGAYITTHFGSGPDAYDNFVDALGNVGTTKRAVLDEMERHLMARQLYEHVTRTVQVNEQELRRAYEHLGWSLGTPETRRLRNIVVRTHRQAMFVARLARSGKSFSALAQRYSIDGGTRAKGGRLGMVSAEQLQGEYAAKAFSTPRGATYGPVRTTHGWNVGMVEDVVSRRLPDYAAVRERLRLLVQSHQQQRRWATWLKTAMKEADLVYSAAYRPAHPSSLPPVTTEGSAPWG